MWPLKRTKKVTTGVPEEVQEYYQSEKREKVGVAWLLALGTLIATLVIALGLFYGGRWVWRELFGSKAARPTTTQQTQKQGSTTTPSNNSSETPSSNTGQTAPSSASAPTPTTTPTTTSATTQQPAASGKLTNTGPGDTLAIFLGVTVVGTLAHQAYTRRKLTR